MPKCFIIFGEWNCLMTEARAEWIELDVRARFPKEVTEL